MRAPLLVLIKLLNFILLLHFISSEQYQIPPLTQLQEKLLKLNEIKYLNQPRVNLNKIYKRQIFQTSQQPYNNSNFYRQSQICKQQPPQITFQYVGYQPLLQIDSYAQTSANNTTKYQSERIVYDYQVLKSKYQNILDMYHYSNYIFTISSTGLINIYKIDVNKQNGLQHFKSIKSIDWDQLNKNRLNDWKQRQERQKDRVTQIKNETLLGGDQSNKTRLLQQTVQNQEISSKDQSQIYSQYYTGPPPIPLTAHLSKGYFQLIQNNSTLLFSNNNFIIALDMRTFQTTLLSEQIQYGQLIIEANNKNNGNNSSPALNNSSAPSDKPIIGMIPPKLYQFTEIAYFQEIAEIDEDHFAVVDRKYGVYIYQLIRSYTFNQTIADNLPSLMIRQVSHLAVQNFKSIYAPNQEMDLMDIQYNKKNGILYILDYQKGILSFNVSRKVIEGSQKLVVEFNYGAILRKGCTIMQFSQIQQNIYLVCNKIYRINIQKWPIIEQKTFTHPLIQIKQIFIQQNKNLFVLAGYTVFKVIYLDRTTNYFQDDMLDKLIFTDNFTITANQNHIMVLNYNVNKPAIVCQTNNQNQLGIHHLVLRTTGECSEQYLKMVNYQELYNKKFEKNDVCVYTVFKNLYVWQLGQVPLKPLGIIMLVFLIFMAVMIIWFILVRFRMQRAQQHLKYLSQQGHKQLVQQDVKSDRKQQNVMKGQKNNEYNSQSSQKRTGNQTQQKQTSKNHTNEDQVNKDFYSIQ